MEKITMNAGQIYLLAPFLLGLESEDLKFATRRKLLRFNEKLKVEYEEIRKEIVKILGEYCDKDDEGKPVITEDRYMFTQGQIDKVNEKIREVELSVIELEYEPFAIEEKYFDSFKCGKDIIEIIEKYFL